MSSSRSAQSCCIASILDLHPDASGLALESGSASTSNCVLCACDVCWRGIGLSLRCLSLYSLVILIKSQYCILLVNQSIKCICKALFTSADVTKCYTDTQTKTLNSKQYRCRSTVARKPPLERQEPRKKSREEPGSEGWPVLFWLCRVEIITVHGQDVQTFIDDQQGQIIIIITVVVEGATGQHLRSKCQLTFHSRSFRQQAR